MAADVFSLHWAGRPTQWWRSSCCWPMWLWPRKSRRSSPTAPVCDGTQPHPPPTLTRSSRPPSPRSVEVGYAMDGGLHNWCEYTQWIKHSLSYQALTTWNKLPASMGHTSSVSSFRSSLKTSLFSWTFSSVPLPWGACVCQGVCVCVCVYECVCVRKCGCICLLFVYFNFWCPIYIYIYICVWDS